MERRSFLKRGAALGAGLLAAPTAGSVVGAAGAGNVGYQPVGSVRVEGAAEAVVAPDGDTVFVATGDGFASVYVADPANPEVLSTVSGIAEDREDGPLEQILDVKVAGDSLLVVGPAQQGSPAGLAVYDVSAPTTPTPEVEFYRTGFPIHNADFDGEYAYLTNNAAPDRPMTVVDVSSGSPTEVARWSPLDVSLPDVEGWDDASSVPGVIHDLYVHDGMAYCVYWDAGTWMVDVSDPSDPTYVGRVGDYDLETLLSASRGEFGQLYSEGPGNDHYVTVDEDASLMAVGGEGWDDPATEGGGPAGIDLYDISDPASPDLRSRIHPETAPDLTRQGTWTTAHNFDLQGGRLYSSWYDAGVKVHDVSDPASPELLAWWRDPDEARFWTAQAGVVGEFFVASSYPAGGHRPALYVFPDGEGTQTDPPEPFRRSEKWNPLAPIPAEYYDEGGVVTTSRLQRAVGDWARGSIPTDTLNAVIQYWATGEDVRYDN